MSTRAKKILTFLAMTFVLDWSMVYLYLGLGGKWEGIGPVVLAVAYMFVPMISAIIVQKGIFKEPLIKPLGISFKINAWFFVAWLLPVALGFATMGASLLLPGIAFTPDLSGYLSSIGSSLTPEQLDQARQQLASMPVSPVWLILLQTLIAGTTVNAVAGFGEELGWRGLLIQELGFMGFWKSSALIGLIWGIWHMPLILQGHNYPQHPQIGVLMMTGWTILMAPLFSYIRLKGKSVIAASIFHGTINAAYGLSIILIKGGDDLTVGMTGLAGFIAFGIADLAIFIYDRFITREPASTLLKNIQ
jgi:uncharacterized protein